MTIKFNEDLLKQDNRKELQINDSLILMAKPLYFINDSEIFYYLTDHKECRINHKIGDIMQVAYMESLSDLALKNKIILYRPYDSLTNEDLNKLFYMSMDNPNKKVEYENTLLLINLLMKTNRYIFRYFINIFSETSNQKQLAINLFKLFYDREPATQYIYPKDFCLPEVIEDKEAEAEIELIKKYVPYNERYKYFR